MNDLEKFPTGKKRKEIIRENQEKIKHFEVTGKEEINLNKHYTFVDSSLDNYSTSKGVPFFESFYRVLPRSSENMTNYIQKFLKPKRGKAIGLEFGGIGSGVFHSFSPGVFAKSVGVTLVDHRDGEELAQSKKEDKKINHETLEGDIFDLKTYESLNKLLEGKKVDFIVSRMAKGLEFVPVEPYTVSKILKIWYELLAEEGIMFVQTPIAFNNLLKDWAEKIKKECKSLEISFFASGFCDVDGCSSFRLRKLPGAPKELPLLDPRSVRKSFIYKND